jgi:hypothetical protein
MLWFRIRYYKQPPSPALIRQHVLRRREHNIVQLNIRVRSTSVLLQSCWLRDSPINHDHIHCYQYDHRIIDDHDNFAMDSRAVCDCWRLCSHNYFA